MLDQTATTTEPDTDHVYALLADEERRAIIRLLADADGSLPPAALVERYADAAAVSREEARRFPLRLHHVHLPKLTNAAVVASDADDELELTPTGYRVEAVRRETSSILGTR